MKILIKNATLVSMDSKREKIENNIDILIKDKEIIQIGKNIQEDENTNIIDATDKVAMPGLINTHAHIPMSIFRETLDGYSLQDWLSQKIWPMEAKLTNEDIYYASLLSFIEMIETGCTTINDMYFMTDEIIKAMKDTGIRLQTSTTLMNMASEELGEKRFQELEQLINNYRNSDEKLTLNVGIHGLYTGKRDYIRRGIKYAEERNIPVHIHFCENSKERQDIKLLHDESPIEILKEDFQTVHTILAHGVKISKEELKQIKNMDISFSHCPVSNLKLGCGIADINEMLENGINVSIGTDGQGSGSNLDLFEAMKFTGLLQKGNTENPKVMPAYEVLKMATINGAKALKLENEIGTIEVGKKADLIILDMDNTEVNPQNDLISEIVYNVKGKNVDTTIVSGKVLMQNCQLKINIDKNKIIEKCNEIIKRISL